MRFLCTLAVFIFATIGRAAEWRNDQYGVSANLPDSAGWQPIEAGSTPAMAILVYMQNAQKQAVFGINVLHNLPNSNLRDPATIAAVEKSLRDLGYQFFGRATVNVGGREWVQFPVRGSNPPTSGLIRYTSANDRVYVVSLLRGGGQEAAQDPELLASAASVRIAAGQAPATGVAATPAAPPLTPSPGGTSAPATSTPAAPAPATTASETDEVEQPVKIGPVTITRQQFRLGLYAIGGLVVLLILLKIIGGSGGDRPPENRR